VSAPTVVLVPGLRGHVEEHWQTHLAHRIPGAVTVDSYGREKLDLAGRAADLEQAVASAPGPVLLVAHSAGCLVTLHWARHGAPHGARRHSTAKVVGALLATPPDLGEELPDGYPTLMEMWEAGWLPLPTEPLPFPSLVAASSNDPLSDPDRIRALAVAWGSEHVDVGPVGHPNPASGYGDWPLADQLVDRLSTSLTLIS